LKEYDEDRLVDLVALHQRKTYASMLSD